MNPNYLVIAHVLFVTLFVSATFVAIAAPTPERKRKMAMFSGIMGLLAFIAGFGLLDMMGHGSPANALRYPLWAYVKMGVWVVLGVLGVVVFRVPGRARLFGLVTIVLVLVALIMVYLRP